MINQFVWQDILLEAERRGMPSAKKRAILREFLQIKFLTTLYSLPGCQQLSFIGGTSLRLLRGLDRFSEDLDFDNFGLQADEIRGLFVKAARYFKKEGYVLKFDFRQTKNGGTARLRFLNLLQLLGISRHPQEKLMIRLDFTPQKRIQTEVILLTGFGMSERVVTNTLPVLISQKFRALILRKQTRGRDFYDLYWLMAKKIDPDLSLLKDFDIKTKKDFLEKLKKFYQQERKNITFYKKQIKPFLLNEERQKYLDFYEELLA